MNRTPQSSLRPRTVLRPLSIFLFAAGSIAVATALADEGTKLSAHLVYVLADPESANAEGLSKCDRLTIEKYRELGARVSEKTPAEFRKWLEGEGKNHSQAYRGMQRLAYAKSLGADAIGGLTSFEATLQDGAPKSVFDSWGIALSACSGGGRADFEAGTTIRAIPLYLAGQSGDAWSIPKGIEPKPCSGVDFSGAMSFGKGRPFLGVQWDGSTIKKVIDGSPAQAAGLEVGDRLLKADGKEVPDAGALSEVLLSHKPGDEIDIEFIHGETAMTKRVALGDYFDVVESKRPGPGQALPALLGKDIDGREVKMADFKGKVVLIDFWATWCGPCKEEMPLLQLLWEKANDKDFVWVSVSADEDAQAWRDFVRNNKLGGVQLLSREWADQMSINSFPTVFLVDRAGVIQCNLRGESIAQAAWSMLAKP